MAPDRIFLEQAGDAILVLELQGALFFGTGEKILSEVDVALRHETSCVILDLRRLTEIDSTGATALLELKRGLIQQKKRLLLAVSDRMAMERLESFGVLSSNGETNIFPDIDRAIEWAENSLLYAQPQLHRDEILAGGDWAIRKVRFDGLGGNRVAPATYFVPTGRHNLPRRRPRCGIIRLSQCHKSKVRAKVTHWQQKKISSASRTMTTAFEERHRRRLPFRSPSIAPRPSTITIAP